MLDWIASLLKDPAREARRLNRDTAAILESVTTGYPIESVRDMAVMTAKEIGQAQAHLEMYPDAREEVLSRLTLQHRESRRRMNQVALTAFTLAIIYLRAQALGDACREATDAIDEFTGHWAHAAREES